MSRQKLDVPTPAWVTVGGKERRAEEISKREQKTAGMPPPKPKAPDGTLYNIGG